MSCEPVHGWLFDLKCVDLTQWAVEGNWKSASAHCAVTSRLSPGVSLRQQQRWRRSHRPRALPVVSLPATRQCHSSPCRAEHTVRYEPSTSQHRKASNVQLEPWPLINIKPLHPPIPTILLSPILYPLWVQHLPTSKVPNRETTTRSKQAAAGLLDRLVRDALQSATKEGYIKIANMLGDIADAHTPLEGRCPCSQYRCWLQQQVLSPSFLFLIPSTQLCSTRQLVCPLPLTSSSRRPPCIRQNSSVVDESLPKQQKELLCQQSAVSQRELSAFQRSFSNSTASSPADRGSKSELDDD